MVRSSYSGVDGGRGGGGEDEEEGEEEEGRPNERRKKATREQVAAMRKESVALRARVAAALVQAEVSGVPRGGGTGPMPPAATDPRAARRREYPIFTPSYGDPDWLPGGGDSSSNNTAVNNHRSLQSKHHRITSGQIWLQEAYHHHHHHNVSAQSVQHEQFVAPRGHVTPGNSFRSLPAHVRGSLSSSPIPPSLLGLSPNDVRQQQQHLNRLSSPRLMQSRHRHHHHHHHHSDHPVSPVLSMLHHPARENFFQDSKSEHLQVRTRTRSLGHRTSSIIETSNNRSNSVVPPPGLAQGDVMGNQGNQVSAGGCVNPSPSTSNWGNCTGGHSTVVPVAAIGVSATPGSIIDPPKTATQQVDEVSPPHQEQSAITATPSGYFNFLAWGGLNKKKPEGSKVVGRSHVMTSESGRIINNNNTNQDTIVNLENTVKTLQLKLDESNKNRAAAVYEARTLRLAMEILDEKFKLLQKQCQELQQQQRSSQQMLQNLRNLDLEKVQLENFVLGEEEDNNNNITEATTTTTTTTPGATSVRTQRVAAAASSCSVHPKVNPELFLTTVENARRSLKKLTDVICHHIRELGGSLTHVINSLLKQQNLGIKPPRSQMPRAVKVLYFEAFVNQVMFESFENVDFESNGATNIFNWETLQATSLQSFEELKKQEWPEIEKALSVEAQQHCGVIVSSSFHQFFVVRMEMVISQFGKLGEINMPVSVITAFYNAVKGVWLVHHLAFAFKPASVTIFRIAPGSDFNPMYMEEEHNIPTRISKRDDQVWSSGGGGPHVSVMVSPGFIVDTEVCKSRVFCCSSGK